MMLKLKLQYFGHLMRRVDSVERLWCWEEFGAGGEGDNRGWDGWMASLTRWTWVWMNSRSWWWTWKPGVLWFMGSQRVGHDWATELNWYVYHVSCIYIAGYSYVTCCIVLLVYIYIYIFVFFNIFTKSSVPLLKLYCFPSCSSTMKSILKHAGETVKNCTQENIWENCDCLLYEQWPCNLSLNEHSSRVKGKIINN